MIVPPPRAARRRPSHAPRLLLACALAGACGDAGSGGTTAASETSATTDVPELEGTMVDLARPALWQPLAAADDPLAAHRPDAIECPLGTGWLVEPTGFEVNTGACNYAAFVQPALAAVAPGAQISIDLYHFDLLAPEPATAHLAVLVGDVVVFERDIAIPGPANVHEIELVADFSAPAGTPVVLHLHNHGQNTWTFGSFRVEVADP